MHNSLRLSFLLWLAAVLLFSACSSVTPNAPAVLESQATLTVTNENDSGPGSLREAITTASAGDTITFADSVKTITLSSGLGVGTDLTIVGPEGGGVTVSGNDAVRVFVMDTSTTVELRNLTVTGGFADTSGGGILNRGALTVTNSTVSGNRANHYGGGIDNQGTLTITNSAVSGNSVGYGGGGILNRGALTVTNSTVSGNSASNNGGYGGGIGNQGTLAVTSSTVSGNSAGSGPTQTAKLRDGDTNCKVLSLRQRELEEERKSAQW